MKRRGQLFIVSAPSGAGKTTLVRKLVKSVSGMVVSRSYTSRSPRVGEVDGVDYNFIDSARFKEMVEAGAFLEWAKVFGHRYGTSFSDTEFLRSEGLDVVLVIDVQGAEQVRRENDAVGIFVMPPSFEELEARLRGRSKEKISEADVRQRLATASREVDCRERYDYVVVNDTINEAVDVLRSIVLAERSRTSSAVSESSSGTESFGPVTSKD